MTPNNLFTDSGKIKPVVYLAYWLIYVLLFVFIQGWQAEQYSTVFFNELLSLLPRIFFVYLVTDWLVDKFLLKLRPILFLTLYLILIIFFAFVLRLIDNFIILKYFLPHWGEEPLFSIPPYLNNVIKLQFVVTCPFVFKLFYYWQKEKKQISFIQNAQQTPQPAGNPPEDTARVEGGFISIRCERKVVKVFLDEIHYLEAQRNYVIVYTKNEIYRTYLSISEMQEKLPGDQFLRVHRSFIVSLNKVKAHTSSVVFVLNQHIPIGRVYSGNLDGVLWKI
ncbi:LytR/AlgR family response regulator transcription factor [Daejeonella oryzae]|uniref:LytR/AlgR family response regulator transcription factor n=1 Tax=Daejeonella oryzae TaxID=1122943 RepID=UPI00040B64FE|nr:LytTR family DNA-binding domain-containing protein [Daejeonella oryzae]